MSRLRAVGAISRVGLLRMWRDRSNRFSMVVLPLLLVLLVGLQFGGEQRATIAVAGTGPAADELVDRLEEEGSAEVVRVDDLDEVRDEVAGGGAGLGIVLPDDVDELLAAGRPVQLTAVSDEDGSGASLAPLVTRTLGEVARVGTAAAALTDQGVDADEARAAVEAASASVPPVGVVVDGAGDGEGDDEGRGSRFAGGAAQQLTLITFLSTVLSTFAVVQARTAGISHRMLAAPVSVGTVVLGETAARWAVAVVQGGYVMVASALLFGVGWGNPALAVVVLAAFGLVGAGIGMVIGALVDDENVVVGIALVTGLGVAALGGAMLPVELFPSGLATVAGFTPHDRAIEALTALRDGDAVRAALVPVVQLTVAGAALVAAGIALHRRVLLRAT